MTTASADARGAAAPSRADIRTHDLDTSPRIDEPSPGSFTHPWLTLAEHLGRAGALDALTATRLAHGLLEVLRAAHATRGPIGHLRPTTVMLDPHALWDRPRLAEREPADGAAVRARCRAPELSGPLARPPDERADLYALGVLVQECVAGNMPRALAALVARLSAREPRDRYRTAAGALADFAALEAALARGEADPELVPGRHDRRDDLVEPAFVGRRDALAALVDALARATSGRGGSVVVEGESGAGKTRLLDELALRAAARGALVLRGGAVDDALAPALVTFDGIAHGLRLAALDDRRFGADLAGRLGTHAGLLATLLPELGLALGLEPGAAEGPEAFAEQRLEDALVSLLAACGTAGRPALVTLDDAQWAYATPALLPRVLQRLDRHAPLHVLVVVAMRAEEVGADHPLRGVARAPLQVTTLDDDDIDALAQSMAGPLPPEALRIVRAHAQGSPLLAAATLHELVERRALVHVDGAWRAAPSAAKEPEGSARVGDVLLGRLARLSSDEASLLAIGALVGRAFDRELAAAIAGLDPDRARAAIAAATIRRLVHDEGARVRFAHDRVRQGLIDALEPARRRALHLAIAQRLEGTEGPDPLELAHHFDAAGDATRAYPHALVAATRARDSGVFGLAERCYRIAERGASQGDAAARARLAEALGEVMIFTRRPGDAPRELARARALMGRPEDAARVLALEAEAHYREGDFERMHASAERGLALLGRRIPASTAALVGAVCLQVVALAFGWLPRRRRPLAHAPHAQLAVRHYGSLVFSSFLVRTPLAAFWAHLNELNLARRFAPSAELARALMNHGVALGQIPWQRRARRFFAQAREAARAVADPVSEGASDTYHAMVLSWGGEHARALEVALAARATLERAGDHFGRVATGGPVSLALYRLGRVTEALAASRSYFEEGLETTDDSAVGTALLVWCLASGGAVPEAALARARARCRAAYPSIFVATAEGLTRLARGELDGAIEALERADLLVGSQRNGIVADVACWLLTALRMRAERSPPHHPERRRDLARARRVMRRCRTWARICTGVAPHVLREAALLHALAGRARPAERALTRSLACARAQSARLEEARSGVARGLVGRALGWPDAERDLLAARTALEAIGGAGALDRVALGGPGASGDPVARAELVAAAGCRIVAARTRGEVREALIAGACELLAAERCEVHDEATAPPDELADPSALPFTVVARGRVVWHVRAIGAPSTDAQAQGTRRLASLLGALAGAALETVDELVHLAGSEQRVRDVARAELDAREDERRRLALTLHDGAGQALGAALMQVDALAASCPGAAGPIAALRDLLTGTADELRKMAHDLTPLALDAAGLPTALRELARGVAGTSLDAVVQGAGEVERAACAALPATVSGQLYRIAQAALANVMAHARATAVVLSLRATEAELVLEVRDDGAGFDVAGLGARRGLGLVGMQERAAAIGGVLTLRSAPGDGTCVRVTLPRGGP